MNCLLQCQSMVIVPIVGCVASFFWTIWIIMAFIHVFAEGITIKAAPTEADEVDRYAFYGWEILNMIFHLGAFLYGNAFISGVCKMVTAANAAIWYFSPSEDGTV